MEKKVIFASIAFLLILLSLICWFIYAAKNSPTGPPNPPISEKAICNIAKNEDEIFLITCKNNSAFAGLLYVASSKEDLNPYLGKAVQIEANYLMNQTNTDSVMTNQQCIKNQCRQLFKDKSQETYAIVIEKVKAL